MPDERTLSVEFSPEFKRNLRRLAKKYRNIRSDLEPVLAHLGAGEALGDRIQGSGQTIYKLRIKNSDLEKGKRAGYRLIYWLALPEKIILLTIYSKTEQGDISFHRIRQILQEIS